MGREPTLYDGAVKYFFGVNPVIPCFHVAEWRTSQWCNTLLPVEILRKMECNESPNSNNHYIPGSQMGPLVLIVKGHLLEGWIPKIEDKQVPGIWCFQISIQLKNKRASLIQPQFLWKKSSSPNSFFVFFVSLTKIPKQKKKSSKTIPHRMTLPAGRSSSRHSLGGRSRSGGCKSIGHHRGKGDLLGKTRRKFPGTKGWALLVSSMGQKEKHQIQRGCWGIRDQRFAKFGSTSQKPRMLRRLRRLRVSRCFRWDSSRSFQKSCIRHPWWWLPVLETNNLEKHTLPETNIASENGPSQKETSIPTIHF